MTLESRETGRKLAHLLLELGHARLQPWDQLQLDLQVMLEVQLGAFAFSYRIAVW